MQKVDKIILLITVLFLLTGCAIPYQNEIDLRPGFEPTISIIQISDLHIKKEKKLLSNLIDSINTIHPDIIVMTGDLIESPDGYPFLKQYMERIDSHAKKYAILGNWEYAGNVHVEEYRKFLKSLGITLLVNQQDTLAIKGRRITLYGVDDYLRGHPTFINFTPDPDALNIILAHCPILFDDMIKAYSDFPMEFYMLSGHTHGGQITFFGIPLYLPEGSGSYCSGAYHQDNGHLFVSKGIGYSQIDLRVFARSSFNLFSY